MSELKLPANLEDGENSRIFALKNKYKIGTKLTEMYMCDRFP